MEKCGNISSCQGREELKKKNWSKKMPNFESEILVTLSDTDAAGVVYFARFYDIAHRAMEEHFAKTNLSLGLMLREKDYITPVTSSSAEYKKPLRLSDRVRVSGNFAIESESTFATRIELFLPNDELSASVQFVHTCIDKKTWKRRALPEEMRECLKRRS
jgi:1,4-dihydroxy-2-naphthoyl-CoA hydrolase